jgi:hypothetical protein
VPFVFNVEQAYALEFGNQYIRFYRGRSSEAEAGLIVGNTLGNNPAWATGTTYYNGDIIEFSSVIYRCIKDNTAVAGGGDGAGGEPNTNTTEWGTPSLTSDNFPIYEVVSPYLTADLFELKFEHSNDVMWIAHPDYEPRRLSRLSLCTWRLTEEAFEDGPFRTQNVDTAKTITASATTGTVTLTATGHTPFRTGTTAGHSPSGSGPSDKSITGALFKVLHAEEQRSVESRFTSTGVTSSTLTVYKGTEWRFVTNGTWTGKVILERSYDDTVWEEVWSVSSQNNNNEQVKEVEEFADASFRMRSELGAFTAWSGTATCEVAVVAQDHIGIVEITAVASPTSATGTVLTTLGGTEASHRWSEGSWSNYRGWPATVAISPEERLTYAGSTSEPLTVWGSVISDFTSMDEGSALDDDAIIFTLVGRGFQNQIHWMVSEDNIILGTTGGEHVLGASSEDEPITPTNVRAKVLSAFGSENIQALLVNDAILFVKKGGRRVMEMAHSFEQDKKVGDDLTTWAQHITESRIVDWAYQRAPDPMVWAVRTDGELAVMAYDKRQNVFAWSRLTTTDSTSQSEYESVCVIPTPFEEDQVFVVVKRTIGGATKRFIEWFSTRDFATKDDGHFVDADIISDTLAWTCTPVNDLVGDYPILNDLTAAEIPTIPATPADATGSFTNVSTEIGLQAMAAGTNYKLVNDITITGPFTPIANYDGIFDGGGFSIINLDVNGGASDSQGLFSTLVTGARIQNVIFSNANVDGDNNVGVLVGFIDDQTSPTDIIIKSVTVTNSVVTCSSDGGLLVGRIRNSQGDIKIHGCIASGSVTADSAVVASIGGMVGSWNCQAGTDEIVNCSTSDGTGSGVFSDNAGGDCGGLIGGGNGKVTAAAIVGQLDIHTCSSAMTVLATETGAASNMGGLVGRYGIGDVTTCFATGTVTYQEDDGTGDSMGGFMGFNSGWSTFINCYSTGAVLCESVDEGISGGCGSVNVAGFIGKNDCVESTYLRCYTTSTITIKNSVTDAAGEIVQNTGGMFGMLSGGSDAARDPGDIDRCWAEGTITLDDASYNVGSGDGFQGTGGFVGHVFNYPPAVDDCYSWSLISSVRTPDDDADGTVGGFCGDTGQGTSDILEAFDLTNCYHAVPDVTSGLPAVPNLGGFLGVAGTFGLTTSTSFFDSETNGTSDDAATTVTGQTTAVMKTMTTYSDAGWDIGPVDGDTDDSIWYMPASSSRPEQNRNLWYPPDFAHLNSETVQLLVDGAVAPDETVAAGAVAGDTGTTNHVGLGYTSKLQPMKIDSTIFQKSISKVHARLYKTMGGKYGEDDTALFPIITRDRDDAFGDSGALFTGTKELEFDGSYQRDGDIWIQQDQPLPMTLLALDVKMTLEDGST